MDADDIIEGEAVEVPTRAVTVAPQPVQSSLIVGGTAGLALMSDEAFEENLAGLMKIRERVDRVKLAIMRENVDYGTIPGTPKPTLLKPGAETLLRTFGLADSYIIERTLGDGETGPDITYEVRARIHIGDADGPVIAEGVGEANSWEKKHRYRGFAARVCPDCGATAIKRGKDWHTKDPNWYCDKKADGCGRNYPDKDQRITSQDAGQQENDDPYDLANTLIKMAKKRALVDGVLTATGTSGVFTQDEDAPGHRQNQPQPTPQPQAAPSRAKAAPSTAPAPVAAPEPSETGGEVYTGPLREQTDGMRAIRTGGYKVELKMKVGNRNHTAIVIGTDDQVHPLTTLASGETLTVHGRLTERKWAEDKPPVKEIVDVTRVLSGSTVLFDLGGVQQTLEEPKVEPIAAAEPVPEVWAVYPEEEALNIPVTLASWEMKPYPNAPDRPPYFRAVFVQEDGQLLQATSKTEELIDDGYLEEGTDAPRFRWEPGAKLQLLGVFSKGERPRGWVLITAIGDRK